MSTRLIEELEQAADLYDKHVEWDRVAFTVPSPWEPRAAALRARIARLREEEAKHGAGKFYDGCVGCHMYIRLAGPIDPSKRQCTGGILRAMCWHPDGQGHAGQHDYVMPEGRPKWKATDPREEPGT